MFVAADMKMRTMGHLVILAGSQNVLFPKFVYGSDRPLGPERLRGPPAQVPHGQLSMSVKMSTATDEITVFVY